MATHEQWHVAAGWIESERPRIGSGARRDIVEARRGEAVQVKAEFGDSVDTGASARPPHVGRVMELVEGRIRESGTVRATQVRPPAGLTREGAGLRPPERGPDRGACARGGGILRRLCPPSR